MALQDHNKENRPHSDGDRLVYYLLTDKAVPPSKSTPDSAGYDLCSAENAIVPARGRITVSTDLSFDMPSGCYGRIASRSGLSALHGIEVGAGTVDSDYTGNVKVVLYNHTDRNFVVTVGNKVAQLICVKYYCGGAVYGGKRNERVTQRLNRTAMMRND